MNEEYIYHYGVLGMKWGVRRALRKEKRERKKALKRLTLLSTEELTSRIKRLEDEKKLSDLSRTKIQKASKEIGSILKTSGKTAIIKILPNLLSYGVAAKLKKKKSSMSDLGDIIAKSMGISDLFNTKALEVSGEKENKKKTKKD